MYEADSFMKEGRKLRLVLNHRRQADNALRLGLIDQKRYKQTVERLDGKRGQEDAQEEALRVYLAEGGFLQDLPTDRGVHGKVVGGKLVPEPGYFEDRVEKLTDDQQAEYLRAFGPGTDLGLVRKYANVRLTGLLRSMLLHVDQVDLGSIERECRGLTRIQGWSAGDACSQVADVAHFLGELSQEERRVRCEILRQLDEKSSKDCVITLTLDFSSGSIQSNNSDSTFMVRPHPDYLAAVRLPLDRLRLAQRTGSTRTKREEAEERAVWNRDMSLINSLRNGEEYKAAWSSLDRAKEAPEEVVRLVAPCVEALIEHGRTMVHTEHLNVGFWIDKITIALTRLKRWDDAKAWLDRFFALPERQQKGSSPSEQGAMRKRLERCRKMQDR